MSEATTPHKQYTTPPGELGPGQTSYTTITEGISNIALTKSAPIPWYVTALVGFGMMQVLLIAVA